jgi:uncharacterized protein YdaU (DUF1376 family)
MRDVPMAEFPAMQLWTDAYLGDTAHLTTTEHGAYLLLLMTAWRTSDCSLPDDDRMLARYARMTPTQWARIKPLMLTFWHVENGRWKQRRLTDEWVAVRQKREAAAANGKLSALKKKGRHSTKREPSVNEASTTTTTATANDVIANAITHKPRKSAASDDAGFERFWARYPKRIGKQAAIKAWQAAHKRGHDTERIMAGLARYDGCWPDDAQFIPHAATWLNQGRYDDEPQKGQHNGNGHMERHNGQGVGEYRRSPGLEWAKQQFALGDDGGTIEADA